MRSNLSALAVLTLTLPGAASAQLSWEAPPLPGAGSPPGLSVFALEGSPGGGFGLLTEWTRERGALKVAWRAGAARDASRDAAVFGGVTASGLLATGVEGADVTVGWWSGVGGSVGGDVWVGLPIGLVVGWQGRGDDVVFSPYAGAHTSLALGGADGADLTASVDLGLDLGLSSGWVVRFAASVGESSALALGIHVPRRSRRAN